MLKECEFGKLARALRDQPQPKKSKRCKMQKNILGMAILIPTILISCGSNTSNVTTSKVQPFILKGRIAGWSQGVAEVRVRIPLADNTFKDGDSATIANDGTFSIILPSKEALSVKASAQALVAEFRRICIKTDIQTNNAIADLYIIDEMKIVYQNGTTKAIFPSREYGLTYASADVNIFGECERVSSALRPPDLDKVDLKFKEGYNIIKINYLPTNRDVYEYLVLENMEIPFKFSKF